MRIGEIDKPPKIFSREWGVCGEYQPKAGDWELGVGDQQAAKGN
jgi:hypothetical protein